VSTLRVLLARVRALFRPGASDSELEQDIQAHLELLAEDYERRGLSAADARAAARRDFGGVEQMKEAYRDQRGIPLLESLLQDLRYACRTLAHSPGVTLTAIVTIALGVFGPTVTFTMAKAWILEPLPFERPHELVDLRALDSKTGDFGSVNAADFSDWQKSAQSFEALVAYRQTDVRLTGPDRTERLRGALVSPEFFRVLGVRARSGRLFDDVGKSAQQDRQVVLGHLYWREQLAGDEGVVGRTLRLNGEEHEVIGVLPEAFQFTLLGRCDVWRPLLITPEQAADRRGGGLVGLGRLRQGRALGDARRELSQIAADLAAAHPGTNARRGVRVLSLADEVRRHHDLGFIVPLMGAMVACVLLIACVNVTNVMLARASTRRQEMAVRLALGASRSRIVRQWLVEHVLLFVAASALGVVLSVYGADWITQSIPVESRPYLRDYAKLPVDGVVVLFALGVGALCGVLFGWYPAWNGTRSDVNADLRDESGRSTPGPAGARLRAALMVCQVALALAVLISGGLLVATSRNMQRADVGFEARGLLTLRLGLDTQRYRTPAEQRGFYERLLADLRGRPGVVAAAAGSLVPFGNGGPRAEWFKDGAPETPPAETPLVWLNQVTADYAEAVGLRLRRGRFLTSADGPGSPRAALVSETLAARFFPGQDPLGRRFRLGRGETEPWTVVGVVGDVKNFEAVDGPQPQVHVPFVEQPRAAMTLVLRTRSEPEALAGTARAAVAAADPAEPVTDLETMAARIHRVTAAFQTIASFVTFFGAVTLVLAGVGIYGVIAYSFAQRTREIGIRMALGAQRADVARLVLRQLRGFLLAGLLPGLGLAFALGHAFRSILFGVTPTDWRLYVAMPLLLGSVAALAALVPIRRALAIDPIRALRHD
jgi:putative ABC transport system permease protein